MPEANAATQSAPGAGGPGQGGTPDRQPAQPGGAAAPLADGLVPAAPSAPDGGRQPAPGTGTAEPAKEDRWGNAAASLGLKGEAKRKADRDRMMTRVSELLKRTGTTSLEELEARITATPQPAPQPVQPQPPVAPQPAPPQAVPRGLTPQQALNWHAINYFRLLNGHTESQVVMQDEVNPQTGETQKIPRQVERNVPSDRMMARAYAEEFDEELRKKGVRPPWDGEWGLGLQVMAPPSQPPAQSFTLEEVEERFAQREAAKTAWQGTFAAQMAKAAAEEYGHDWFAEARTVEVNGHQVPMSRGQELAFRCQPSRDFPNGLTLEQGLMAFMMGDTVARIRVVERALARSERPIGGVPTGAPGGPPADPSAIQAHATAMVKSGIAGGNFAPVPLDSAAEVVRVRGGVNLPRSR